jgi:hypothetical protein
MLFKFKKIHFIQKTIKFSFEEKCLKVSARLRHIKSSPLYQFGIERQFLAKIPFVPK